MKPVQNCYRYIKTYLKRPPKKKTKNWFSRPIIAYCRSKVLQNAPSKHSAILLTFIKLPFVFKTFILSIFEWLLKTGFTVSLKSYKMSVCYLRLTLLYTTVIFLAQEAFVKACLSKLESQTWPKIINLMWCS